MYDIAVNVERTTKEKNEFYNEQQGMKRSGDQRGDHGYQQSPKRPREIFPTNTTLITGSAPVHDLVWSAIPMGNVGITLASVVLLSGVSTVEVTCIK